MDTFDHVGGHSKYYSSLDLSQGFFQVGLHEYDRFKTGFSTSFELFQFKRMPMGLSNAPATIQRIVDHACHGMQQKEIFWYHDDAIIHGKTVEEHNMKLKNSLKD